jgi:type IV pilus assembly protein PilC
MKKTNHKAKTKTKKVSLTQKLSSIGTVPAKSLLFFTKNLFIMLKAGTTLSEAIFSLKEQAKNKLKVVLDDIYDEIDKGHQLNEAMEKHPKTFSNVYRNIIKIGEETGELEANLKHLAKQLKKTYDLRKKIVGALIYPVIIMVGGLMLGFGIAVFILPEISGLFKSFNVALPLSTRILMWIADFFEAYGVWAIGGTIFGIIFTYWFLRRKFVHPVTHWLLLRLPVVKSFSHHLNLTSFYRTLSILLGSGLTIDESLKICVGIVNNHYYKKAIKTAYEQIKAGGNLGDFLKDQKKLFPANDIQIIRVGEESGSLADSLSYVSEIHEDEIDNLSKNLSTILEPMLLAFIGGMVGFLALSIIGPIYSITQSFKA